MPWPAEKLEARDREIAALVTQYGTCSAAARAKGLAVATLQSRWTAARSRGWVINDPRLGLPPPLPPLPPDLVTPPETHRAVVEARPIASLSGRLHDALHAAHSGQTLEQLAAAVGYTPGQVLDALHEMQAHGMALYEFSGQWSLERQPAVGGLAGLHVPAITSDAHGRYLIGVIADNHLGNKNARLDVLDAAYRWFADNGVTTVLNAGNWIDGEFSHNKHELLVHGMDAQLQYLGEHYPRHPGMETWAVAGDDHEGWYCQREGVDIGRYAEDVMRRNGRSDWRNLGYMEAFVPLRHAATGATAQCHVVHPGGGTAYAVSYQPQKMAEAYEGGEKPAIAIVGHYHKAFWFCTRNVWMCGAGCTEDQTVFMRKKRLRAELCAGIVRLTQNPETGALEHAGIDQWHFYNRGYYTNNRWSLSGPVTHTPRVPTTGALQMSA